MNRLTLPAVLMATLLVVSVGAVGAVAAPLASAGATMATMQEGDGNTTATPTPAPAANGSDSTNETSGEPPTFGAVVSSFMQTSAADAENEVEDGLFAAQFERSNASERARMVRQRTSNIGARIAELREERAQLLDGGNTTIRERARAARLSEQAEGLSDSIEQTEAAAQRANVQLNGTALEQLRTEARNLTGPEVAELARGLVDRDEAPRRGPPEDRGPGDDATDSLGNETATNESVMDDGVPGQSNQGSGPNGTDANETSASERTPRSGNGSNGDAPDDRPQNDGAGDDGTPTATPTATTTDDGTDGDGGGQSAPSDGTDQ